MKPQFVLLLAVGLAVADVRRAGAQAADSTTREFVGERRTPAFNPDVNADTSVTTRDAPGMVRRSAIEGAVRGAGIGALVGASQTAVASVLALRSDQRSNCGTCVSSLPFVLGFGFGTTAGTAILGAAIGAAAPGYQRADRKP
jgi:hypothetical protein